MEYGSSSLVGNTHNTFSYAACSSLILFSHDFGVVGLGALWQRDKVISQYVCAMVMLEFPPSILRLYFSESSVLCNFNTFWTFCSIIDVWVRIRAQCFIQSEYMHSLFHSVRIHAQAVLFSQNTCTVCFIQSEYMHTLFYSVRIHAQAVLFSQNTCTRCFIQSEYMHTLFYSVRIQAHAVLFSQNTCSSCFIQSEYMHTLSVRIHAHAVLVSQNTCTRCFIQSHIATAATWWSFCSILLFFCVWFPFPFCFVFNTRHQQVTPPHPHNPPFPPAPQCTILQSYQSLLNPTFILF